MLRVASERTVGPVSRAGVRHPAYRTVALLACTACGTTVMQQYAGFAAAPVVPDAIPAHVGDVVSFQVRPPVPSGSLWSLECHGRVRFADDPTGTSLEWTASPRAIRMEAVAAPWDPVTPVDRALARAWLTYALKEMGTSVALDRTLPLRLAPYREVAPVTVASTFAIHEHGPDISVAEKRGRVTVTYTTTADSGRPLAPSVRATLLETDGRKILYAEVITNFGAVAGERIGYDVGFSYAGSVAGPIEVVIAAWVGHGSYYGPFSVHRFTVRTPDKPAEPAEPAATPEPTPPAPTG